MTALSLVVDVPRVTLGACNTCYPENPAVKPSSFDDTIHHMTVWMNGIEVKFSGLVTLEDLKQ